MTKRLAGQENVREYSDPKRLTEKQLKSLLNMAPWDYPKDNHYARYALASIVTPEDAASFIAALDTEAIDGDFGNKTCHKANSARAFMAYDGGRLATDMSWVRISIAQARRTCCPCHDTGSFARRNGSHHREPTRFHG